MLTKALTHLPTNGVHSEFDALLPKYINDMCTGASVVATSTDCAANAVCRENSPRYPVDENKVGTNTPWIKTKMSKCEDVDYETGFLHG